MKPSRGMGAVRDELKKPKRILRKDALEPTKLYAEGGEVWDTPNPKAKSKSLTPAKKASAKATAKAAGRPYPNLIDNMRAARRK